MTSTGIDSGLVLICRGKDDPTSLSAYRPYNGKTFIKTPETSPGGSNLEDLRPIGKTTQFEKGHSTVVAAEQVLSSQHNEGNTIHTR